MKILLLIIFLAFAINNGNGQDLDAIQAAVSGISAALKWAKALQGVQDHKTGVGNFGPAIALDDCVKLYEASEERLERSVKPNMNDNFSSGDAVAWLSGAMAGNMGCLDGLVETGMFLDTSLAKNLNYLLEKALASLAGQSDGGGAGSPSPPSPGGAGLLASWTSAKSSNADVVVAKDGSGQYTTINDALAAVAAMAPNRPERTVIYVKSGTYEEQVNVDYTLKNLFFVGDGIGNTIVTGNRNSHDDSSTSSTSRDSATFAVYADGFWARDVTFQNTAGPQKGQAVALAVDSDQSVFYRCSMEAYQDTLLAWQLRQFYRDCQIHGTIDYVFGDAAAVFQNCDFIVRLPLAGQYNAITAQGRDSSDSKTGFVIMDSRVVPSPEFAPYKGNFKSYLGRPWQRCSRVLFARTNLDDLVDPEGWAELKDDDPCGMFFGEYKNTGSGADTSGRVKSPSFHVVDDASQIVGYSVRVFIQGDVWLPATGVPFSADIQSL